MASVMGRFQFSLGNVFRASAWLCLSGGSYAFLASQWHEDRIHARDYPDWMWPWVVPVLFFLIIWCPVVAIGALFGRTKRGMVAGIGLVVVLLFVVAFILPVPR